MHYRLYVFDKGTRIIRGLDLQCCDDDEAIVMARTHPNEHGLEIWKQGTKVAFLKATSTRLAQN